MQTRVRYRRLVSCLLLALAALPAAALADATGEGEPTVSAGDCSVRVSKAIQVRYDSIRDLQAAFEQSTRSVSLGASPLASSAPSRGTVVFSKPGKMRWVYTEPQPSLVVSDGSTLWLYDELGKEAQRLPVREGYLTGAALEFLLGDGDLLAEFEVRAERCDGPRVRLELVPRKESSYEKLSLTAVAKTGDIVETAIVDLFGNETRIAFSDVRTNQSPPPELFRFDPPPDVEVVDLVTPR